MLIELPEADAGNLRLAYGEALHDLPQAERLKEVQQLLIDMQDWTNQTLEEKLYVELDKLMTKWREDNVRV